ncbi:acyl-CoA thioesterase [Aspergillus undulatus]|uniref:acyl-CoA thioesterase n=1 Tax=Aspergillus undulatus TaxID=1810928 RepID=UPI003CCCB5A4
MPAIAPAERPTFAQALNLEKLSTSTPLSLAGEAEENEVYMSTFPAISYDYAPGQPLSTNRSYGGHTFAQAMWAASLAINDPNPHSRSGSGSESGLRIHEANGYWTQSGHANRPFIYTVKTLSLTRSFALQQVTARQPTTPSDACPFPASDADKELGPVAFVLTCSFKLKERGGGDGGSGYWLNFDAGKYGAILRRDPALLPKDVVFNGIKLAEFPSIDVRTHEYSSGIESESESKNETGTSYRRLHLYRASEPLRIDKLNPNLIAALHAYVSDRAGLSVLLRTFGATELGASGSLNHKIIFHVSPEEMPINGINDKGWFTQEMSSCRGGEGRGVIESRIWNPEGVLVATTIQDALFRRVSDKPRLA